MEKNVLLEQEVNNTRSILATWLLRWFIYNIVKLPKPKNNVYFDVRLDAVNYWLDTNEAGKVLKRQLYKPDISKTLMAYLDKKNKNGFTSALEIVKAMVDTIPINKLNLMTLTARARENFANENR